MAGYQFRATIKELLPALDKGRDARIEETPFGLAIAMDDAGEGEFYRPVTAKEAKALIAEGYCRDAR